MGGIEFQSIPIESFAFSADFIDLSGAKNS